MNHTCRILIAVFIASLAALHAAELPVLTGIGGDPDDQQTLIRLMAYANEFELEALIAAPKMLCDNDLRLMPKYQPGFYQRAARLLEAAGLRFEPETGGIA